jgi:hypothetical protein
VDVALGPAAAALRRGADAGGARGVAARQVPGGARQGRVVAGEVLAEADAASRRLRPDEVADGVDDGLGLLLKYLVTCSI